MRVVCIVVVDSDPFEPRPKIAFHCSDEVANMVLQVHAIGVFRGHDDSPHPLIAGLFPLSDHRDHIDAILFRVESHSLLVLELCTFARQVSCVRGPRVRPGLAIARVHHLDDAPPLRSPALRPNVTSPLTSNLRALGDQVSLFQTHPPRHEGPSLVAAPIRSNSDFDLFFVESRPTSHRTQPLPAFVSALTGALRFLSEPTFREPRLLGEFVHS